MKWPWVSRDRYDEERARTLKLETELKELREILIPQLRPAPPPPIVLTENTDFSKVQPIPGKVTLAMVTAEANKAAFKRAQTPGSKGIAQELAESQKIKAVVNGN